MGHTYRYLPVRIDKWINVSAPLAQPSKAAIFVTPKLHYLEASSILVSFFDSSRNPNASLCLNVEFGLS